MACRRSWNTVVEATIFVLCGFLCLLFVNFQAGIGPDSPLSVGWFKSTVGNISKKYPTPITPADYTFGIWGLIYLWNLAWIIYIITTLFRQNSEGPVYLNPPATSVPFLASFFLNNSANVAWLFLWDEEDLTTAAVVSMVIAFTLYIGMYISLTRVYQYLSEFHQYAESDLWAYRVLVHNGLAIYATWVTVATQINISVSIIYDFDLPSDTATYICLSMLAVDLLVFFALDLFLIDPYTRYVFMVYPTVIWALAGIMVANENDTNGPAFIYAAVLVSLAAVFFITKTVFMSIREPVYQATKKDKISSYSRMI